MTGVTVHHGKNDYEWREQGLNVVEHLNNALANDLGDFSAGTGASRERLTNKIVQHNRKRICVRLEQIYWDVFEEIAREKNCRLNELIHAYYSDPDEKNNKTARLRYIAIEWLSKKKTFYHDQVALSHDEVSAILRSTSQPAIMFTEDQSVTACNDKFYDWLSKNIGVHRKDIDLEKMRISFRRSYQVLLQKFAEEGNSLAREQVSVLLPGYALSVTINLTLLNKINKGQKAFLGFF